MLARRFIPACAGNTMIFSFHSDKNPVHPRVCGEHIYQMYGICNRHGSSPRVRGTPLYPNSPASGDRFIPACAGNTWHTKG